MRIHRPAAILVLSAVAAACSGSDGSTAEPAPTETDTIALAEPSGEERAAEQAAEAEAKAAAREEITPVTDEIVDMCSFIPIDLVADVAGSPIVEIEESSSIVNLPRVDCSYDIGEPVPAVLVIINDEDRLAREFGETFTPRPGIPTASDYVVPEANDSILLASIGKFNVEVVATGDTDRTRLPELMTPVIDALAELGAGQ